MTGYGLTLNETMLQLPTPAESTTRQILLKVQMSLLKIVIKMYSVIIVMYVGACPHLKHFRMDIYDDLYFTFDVVCVSS